MDSRERLHAHGYGWLMISLLLFGAQGVVTQTFLYACTASRWAIGINLGLVVLEVVAVSYAFTRFLAADKIKKG